MNTYYQPQQAYTATPEKQSNPFWYRENAGYLVGVTNAPSNPMFGIENIILTQRTGNQPATLLANGRLATIVGQLTFQIFASGKTGAPYVSTISVKNNNGTYYEHMLLKPQVKAQILRFFEMWANGSMPMNQAPMNVGFNAPQNMVPQPVQPQVQAQQPQQPDMVQMMMAQMQQMQQQMAQMSAGLATPPADKPAEPVVDEGTSVADEELPI